MTGNARAEPMAVRDQAGAWYLLSPEMLAAARATAEQQAALERRFGDDAGGYGILMDQEWLPPARGFGPRGTPQGSFPSDQDYFPIIEC